MLVDLLTYLLVFLLPALDLYGALVEPDQKKSTRETVAVLRHFVVAVAFRTITAPFDVVLGSVFLYELAKLICVAGLIYGAQYGGSGFVYRRLIQPMAKQYPEIMEFAWRAHEGTVFGNAQYLAIGLVSRFRAEYTRILGEIDE
jgi:uncharacterized membrane protein YdfJ with MMPL/SSD domain